MPFSKIKVDIQSPQFRMAKRRNLKKEKQERNRAYARKFKKRKMRNDGRGEGAGNGVTGTANNGGAAD